jgi:hypothetical protein
MSRAPGPEMSRAGSVSRPVVSKSLGPEMSHSKQTPLYDSSPKIWHSCLLMDPTGHLISCALMDPFFVPPSETSCLLLDPKTSCLLMDP